MSDPRPRRQDQVRTAEVVAALSLAADLSMGLPLEHGLRSALVAARLSEILGVDPRTRADAFYASLLFYVGCTATAKASSEIFAEDHALTTYAVPFRFGSPLQMAAGMSRAIAPPGRAPTTRALLLARGVPALVREFREIAGADCAVAQMLTGRLGLPSAVSHLFDHVNDRWDGKGWPARARGEAIPLSVRVAQVARDAEFHRMLGGARFAANVVRRRAGCAFDPHVARRLADHAGEILSFEPGSSAWAETLSSEPAPWPVLEGESIDRALGAIGDFADLVSPYLVGHSSGVAQLVGDAARVCGLGDEDLQRLERAAMLHDLGRVAVPTRTWETRGPLSPDDWERVRLHPYHTERILSRSPFLASLAPVAAFHHERLDGSGYHRGATAAGVSVSARLLAAADAYQAMTEPRPHRDARPARQAACLLGEEVRAGRLDPDVVDAVLTAAGQSAERRARPTALTDRERQVVAMIARGMQTKQVARALGISVKTADHHVQNAYRKMGISTRAGAALFAMQHGLASWGELPMGRSGDRS